MATRNVRLTDEEQEAAREAVHRNRVAASAARIMTLPGDALRRLAGGS